MTLSHRVTFLSENFKCLLGSANTYSPPTRFRPPRGAAGLLHRKTRLARCFLFNVNVQILTGAIYKFDIVNGGLNGFSH